MNKIPFCKSYVGKEEKDAICKVIDSGDLIGCRLVEEFEQQFADYVGSKYAVGVASCTSALHLSIERMGVRGKKVAVPSLTYTASAESIVHLGGYPVWKEVDLHTLLAKDTSCGYMVNVFLTGRTQKIKARNVVHDSAHLLERGCYKGSSQCFSFHPTKSITTGFGGMIATDSKEDYEWFKKARHHGCNKKDWQKTRYGYTVEFLGYKMNMNGIQAAMGIEQLKKLDWMNQERKRCIQRYNEHLGYERKGLHLYSIFVKNRERFMAFMESFGIQCSVHFEPLHKMPAYEMFEPSTPLPVTEWVGDHIVSLPLFPTLTNEQIDFICLTIKKSNQLILP